MNHILKKSAWINSIPVKGKSSEFYRYDPYGNIIYWSSYGKNSKMGWEVDHINPKNNGGIDHPLNVQALKTSVNRSIKDSIDKLSIYDYVTKETIYLRHCDAGIVNECHKNGFNYLAEYYKSFCLS